MCCATSKTVIKLHQLWCLALWCHRDWLLDCLSKQAAVFLSVIAVKKTGANKETLTLYVSVHLIPSVHPPSILPSAYISPADGSGRVPSQRDSVSHRGLIRLPVSCPLLPLSDISTGSLNYLTTPSCALAFKSVHLILAVFKAGFIPRGHSFNKNPKMVSGLPMLGYHTLRIIKYFN